MDAFVNVILSPVHSSLPISTCSFLKERQLFGSVLPPTTSKFSPVGYTFQKSPYNFAHRGCVNTANFNTAGNLLLSGSDDLDVKIWKSSSFFEKDSISLAHTINTQHSNNIFHVEFTPTTDSKVVSSAADGELRMHDLVSQSDSLLGKFPGMVNQFSFSDPNMVFSAIFSHFGGSVQGIDIRCGPEHSMLVVESAESVKQVVPCPWDENVLTVGVGSEIWFMDLRKEDGKPVAVWTMDGISKAEKAVKSFADPFLPSKYHGGFFEYEGSMVKEFFEHRIRLNRSKDVSISSLQFSSIRREILVSYQEDMVYRFPCQDLNSSATPFPVQMFCGAQNFDTFLKRASFFGPNEEYVCCGGDSGSAYVFDASTGNMVNCLKGDETGIVNGVVSSPLHSCVVSYGLDPTLKLWLPCKEDSQFSQTRVKEALESTLIACDRYSSLIRHSRMLEKHDVLTTSLALIAFDDKTLCWGNVVQRFRFCLSHVTDEKEKGNSAFRAGEVSDALTLYVRGVHFCQQACMLFSEVCPLDAKSKLILGRHSPSPNPFPSIVDLELLEECKHVFDQVWTLFGTCSSNAAACMLKLYPRDLAKQILHFANHAIMVDPRSLKARFRRAKALLLLGKMNEAKREVERIKMFPQGKELCANFFAEKEQEE